MTHQAGETSRSDVAAVARRPFWTRISVGQAVMVLAALAAFVLNVNVIRSQESVAMVAVAAEDIDAGVELQPGMLEFVAIDSENPVVGRLVTDTGVAAVVGKVLTDRVPAGEFLSTADLAERAAESNLRAMTVPVDATHAGGGALISQGDVVDIISVAEGRARYVVTGAQVLEVPVADGGGLVGSSDYYVVISVDADTALALAEALQADSLEVVLSTGAPAPERLTLPRARGAQDGTREGEGSGGADG